MICSDFNARSCLYNQHGISQQGFALATALSDVLFTPAIHKSVLKVEQVKAYLNAVQNPKNPLHDAVKEEKECRLARGKSWMGQAEHSIQHVRGLAKLKQVRDWGKRPVEFKPYFKTLLSENLGTHCRKWPTGKANAEEHMLVETNSKLHDIMIYTDGSVTRGRSGWGFTVKQSGRTVY